VKTRIVLIVLAALSILALMVLLSRENVYVVIAILCGLLLLAHREIWSLIRHRRLPVIDERIQHNLTGAMRLTGIFFFIESIVLLLLIRFNVFKNVETSLIVSGQLVVVGLVYLIGYYYYDRVKPNLGKRAAWLLNMMLMVCGLSLSTIGLSIVLHNFVSMWIGMEEPFFFILALLVCPAVFCLSLLGCLIIFVRGLIRPASEETG